MERMGKLARPLAVGTFILRCPGCNRKLSAKILSIGQTFVCPKCGASVTVAAPRLSPPRGTHECSEDPQAKIAAFVYSLQLFAYSKLFSSPEDSLLYSRYRDFEGDATAYPGDVLALLSEFAAHCKILLSRRKEKGNPLPYPNWNDLQAAKRFGHLYWAMANMDLRFAAPFEIADETWSVGQRVDAEIEKVLLSQIENFEVASVAFTEHFARTGHFNRDVLEAAFKTCGIESRPRIERPPAAPEAPPDVRSEPMAERTPRSCSHCSNPLNEHHRFCGDCGQAVGRNCPSCQKPAGDVDRFCQACGTLLAASESKMFAARHAE